MIEVVWMRDKITIFVKRKYNFVLVMINFWLIRSLGCGASIRGWKMLRHNAQIKVCVYLHFCFQGEVKIIFARVDILSVSQFYNIV